MKKSVSFVLSVFFVLMFSSPIMAQPGDPGGCTTGSWSLSASASSVSNNGEVSIYAVYGNEGCPVGGSITVTKASDYVSTSPSLPVSVSIPECIKDPDFECQTGGEILVGTFTLSHSQSSPAQITFQISNITGGHSIGSSTVVTVSP